MAKPLKTLGTNACPKCSKPMERRSHKQPPTKKPFYFSEWDYCPMCRHVQHYEKFKVVCQPKKHVMSQVGEAQRELEVARIITNFFYEVAREWQLNRYTIADGAAVRLEGEIAFDARYLARSIVAAHGRKLAK